MNSLRLSIDGREKRKKISYKPNKNTEIYCNKCSSCGSNQIEQRDGFSKEIIDIKIFKGGAKKWIVRYNSWQYKCLKCRETFISEKFPNRYIKYGHGLMSWCVYHNISRGLNMLQLQKSLADIFELSIPQPELYRFKAKSVKFYNITYKEIFNSILSGPILHIDETPVNLRKTKGYVWVITNMERVYYFYKESRDGEFLTEMLDGFSGVLISDFYSPYDSNDCPQQKCVIHFIRDLNEDLQLNPFDEELKVLTKQSLYATKNI